MLSINSGRSGYSLFLVSKACRPGKYTSGRNPTLLGLSVTNAAFEEERLRGKPAPNIKVSHMVLDRVPNVAHYHLHSGPESLQAINVFLLSSSGLVVDTIVMVILLHLSENGLVNLLV